MTHAPIDFSRIAEAALLCAERLLAHWLPSGHRNGHEWVSINPVRGDTHEGSFSINISTGAWGDFATDDKGGDLVSLCAYLFHGGNQLDAAYDVADQCGIELPPRAGKKKSKPPTPRAAPPAPAEKKRTTWWVPVLPAPESAPAPPLAHIKRGRPERTWCYRDSDGRVLGYAYRFKTSDGGKEILPVVWARHEASGAEEWRWMAFPKPRPLFGLDRLAVWLKARGLA